MSVRYQLVINCIDQESQARFWAEALGYVPAPAPAGYDSWEDYQRHLGVPEEYISKVVDRISDPDGAGPNIWFQPVTDRKSIANRLHLDIKASVDWNLPYKIRKDRIDTEAARLVSLGATIRATSSDDEKPEPDDSTRPYAVGLNDPEGNEFDLN